MKNNYSLKSVVVLIAALIGWQIASASNSSRQLWTKANGQLRSSERSWYPNHYASFTLETEGMRNFLAGAPMEESPASRQSSYVIELPMPDGSFNRYYLVESPVMEKGLADA
jgi:hypothetical protein